MNRAGRIVLNAMLFNAGWLGCVLSSRWGAALMSPVVVAGILALQVMLHERAERGALLRTIAVVGVLGTIVDTGMLWAGVLSFRGSSEISAVFVVWIGAFWVNFAATLLVALRWFRDHLVIAAVVGAVSAPGTYYAGELLGALALNEDRVLAMVALGVEWAVVFPVVLVMSGMMERSRGRAGGESGP